MKEALLAATEPDEASEIRQLEAGGYDAPIMILGGPETEFDRGQSRLWSLRRSAENTLKARLMTGELVATGRDARDPFASRQAIPADRWPYLVIDYAKSAVEAGQAQIVEVEISFDGALHISRQFRRARLGIVHLDLSDRSFDLLLTLAEGAGRGYPFVSLAELKARHFAKSRNPKALGQGMETLKKHIERSGIARNKAEELIGNVRGKGYQLNMRAAEIAIDD